MLESYDFILSALYRRQNVLIQEPEAVENKNYVRDIEAYLKTRFPALRVERTTCSAWCDAFVSVFNGGSANFSRYRQADILVLSAIEDVSDMPHMQESLAREFENTGGLFVFIESYHSVRPVYCPKFQEVLNRAACLKTV